MDNIPHVVILGGGFGGLSAANELRNSLGPSQVKITLIDKKDWFMVGFAKLWIIQGTRTFDNSIGDISKLTKKGINFVKASVDTIDFDKKIIKTTAAADDITYDYLIIALGAHLAPEKIQGLQEHGLILYDHDHLLQIKQKIGSLESGKIAISIMGMPYKCPPAPYEASLIINSMLQKMDKRDSIQIDVYSPAPITLPAAGPQVSQQVLDMITAQNIHFHGSCKVRSVQQNKLIFEDNNDQADFDLLLAVPPHVAPPIIYESGLTQQKQEFIRIGRDCQTKFEDVYAIGDVTALHVDGGTASVPKAGVFAEGEGLIVAKNIISKIMFGTNSKKMLLYDGQGGCFLESGQNTAALINVDMFGQSTPVTKLSESTKQNFDSKIQFEKERLEKWLG